MRSVTSIPTIAALLVVAPGWSAPAAAESWWHAVGDLHLGGVHFVVGYHHGPDGYRRYPGRYYRTAHRLRYRGHRCGSLCYRRGRRDYHHASCPLLDAHARHHGYPGDYFAPYPGRYTPYDDRYRDDDGYWYDDDWRTRRHRKPPRRWRRW